MTDVGGSRRMASRTAAVPGINSYRLTIAIGVDIVYGVLKFGSYRESPERIATKKPRRRQRNEQRVETETTPS